MNEPRHLAPPWDVQSWLNADPNMTLAALRGRVVVALAFQMLCPGCVESAIPQLRRVAATFSVDEVAVLGLHTVFEHHDAMGPHALRAFVHEYRLGFPIAIDRPGRLGPTPSTMARYAMRGTPTLMLIDSEGRLRGQHFGHVSDLRLGAEIARLSTEPPGVPDSDPLDAASAQATCRLPAA